MIAVMPRPVAPLRVLVLAAALATAALACGSSSPAPGPNSGAAGMTSSGSAGASGSAGSSGSAGASGNAGSTGAAGGGPSGTQPLGSACVNTGNCSQADGAAVCCLSMSTCTLTAQCPTGNNFLACGSQADCAAKVGGGKVCCSETTASGVTMDFCTKPSGCSGTVLP